MKNIKEIVVKTVAEVLEISEEEISESSNLVSDLGAESLDLVDLVAFLEEKFDTEIADEDISDIQTVGDIIKYIEKKQDA